MHIEALFTPAQRVLVAHLHSRDQEERRASSTDPLRLKAVSPEVAHYLCLIAVHQRAKTLVEFGTSHGYSTLHLAAAAQHTGGRVFTLDQMPKKPRRPGAICEPPVWTIWWTCHTGTGDVFIAALPDGVDFVFVDFGLHAFAPMFDMLESRLVPGAFLFVDGWSAVEQWYMDPDWTAFKSRLDDSPII